MQTIVVPTLEVLLTWLCIASVLLGCGYLVRRGLVHWRTAAPAPAMSDVWIGLVVLVVYLQVWNLFLALDRVAWIAPIAVGLAGLALIAGGLSQRGWRLRRPSLGIVVVATGLATVWAANRSLAFDSLGDDSLYHLGIVRYAATYPAIPGLANLHERLGAELPNLLFAALLSHGPWAGGANHLVNGFLAALLFVEVGLRFLPSTTQRVPSFTRRFALLLFLSTIVIAELPANPIANLGAPNLLSSLSLDFAAFIFVAVGLLYLAESIEKAPALGPAVTSIAMLSLAAVTRPLHWLTLLLSAAALVVATRSLGGLGTTARSLRAMLPVAVLPVAVTVGWVAEEAVLTGYPFFPLTVVGLPVDWRVPAATVHHYNQAIAAYARHPASGLPAAQVLASWHWLSWWIPTESRDLQLIIPLAIAIVSLAALSLRDVRQHLERRASAAMLGLAVPCAASVVAWFFLAPLPRFALAPIWLLSIALAAWALPTATFDDFSERSVTITVVVTIALFLSLEFSNRHLVLAALAVAVAIVLIGYRYASRAASALARVAAISVLFAAIGFLTSHVALSLVVANRSGTFGAAPDLAPSLARFRTHSGLVLYHPIPSPTDRLGVECWSALFCTPYLNRNLKLRGANFRDGIRSSP